MALSEVVKDLYRLASYPPEADRLFMYVETSPLRNYMAGRTKVYGLRPDVDNVVLGPPDTARLPTTARTSGYRYWNSDPELTMN
jgi:hypothetical protein